MNERECSASWKDEILKRRQEVHKLCKEIKKIERKIKKIGTISFPIYLSEEIKKFGYPCRVFYITDSTIIRVYSKSATAKQVRYNHCEIGSLYVFENDGKYYIDESIKDSPSVYAELPDDIGKIVQLAINSEYRNKYVTENNVCI